MPAYLIVRAQVHDMAQYRQYMQKTPAILATYGGEFLVRGGEKVVLEGADSGERIVLIRFPNAQAAQAMYNSPEYQAAIKLRDGAAEASFIVMEGIE
ncbi:MAG: DUF1330 domain-containing protein [Chloroflexi bacterium]|nr:DUF1330 domain-containing protein [Chloroflexota bacterium]MCY4245984.1 DUF1330 domain-containing protein [Chloroflexota bacterium]